MFVCKQTMSSLTAECTKQRNVYVVAVRFSWMKRSVKACYRLNSTVLSCRLKALNWISSGRSAGKLFHSSKTRILSHINRPILKTLPCLNINVWNTSLQ